MKIDVLITLDSEHLIYTVELDEVTLALRYARRVYKSKGKRSRLAHGAVRISVRPALVCTPLITATTPTVPVPVCDVKGCYNMAESGETTCGNCLDKL